MSLQERWMKQHSHSKANGGQEGCHDYCTQDCPRIHQLTHNYRSHRTIFGLSSDLFYGSSLVQAAAPSLTNSLLSWERLRQAQTEFHEVDVEVSSNNATRGKTVRESETWAH